MHLKNPTVLPLRKKVHQLSHRHSVNKSKVIRKRLQEVKNELKQQYKVLEEEYIASLIEAREGEFKASNTAKAWKVVNTITVRKTVPWGKLICKSPKGRKKQWLTLVTC